MTRRIVTEKRLPVRSDTLNAIDPRQLSLPIGPRTDAERASAIVESLQRLSGTEDVFASFEELDALPTDVVLDALTTWTGPAPDPTTLDDATREAHGFPPPPLHLRTISLVNDADIFDLGEVAEEQLRIAGKLWDGLDLPAEERLDGEVEGSFAGTLEHRVLAIDEDGKKDAPLFDVLRYAEDAGAIFRAGTTDVVGAIADGKIEMRDRRERIAVEAALAAPAEDVVTHAIDEIDDVDDVEAAPQSEPDEVEPEPETEPAPTRRMRSVADKPRASKAPKKATAKKAAAAKKPVEAKPKKKTAAKKATAAKAATKASSTKTPAAKTAAAKAPAAKATAAEAKTEKKTSAKTTAKKTTAKKSAAKKTKKASAKD